MDALEFVIQAARRAGCDCEIEVELNTDGSECPACHSTKPHVRIRHESSCAYFTRQRRIAVAAFN